MNEGTRAALYVSHDSVTLASTMTCWEAFKVLIILHLRSRSSSVTLYSQGIVGTNASTLTFAERVSAAVVFVLGAGSDADAGLRGDKVPVAVSRSAPPVDAALVSEAGELTAVGLW